MKQLIFYSLLVVIIFTSSCKEDETPDIQKDNNGVVIYLSYQWKKSLHEDGIFHSNGHFNNPIVYNENVVIPTTGADGTQYMTMINTTAREILWQWNNVFPDIYGDLNSSRHYIYNNLVTWQQGSRSYCVNLENGLTSWKIQRKTSLGSRINQCFENNFFITGDVIRTDGYNETIAYIGNIETGEIEEFLKTNLSCEYVAPIGENGHVGGISYVNYVTGNNLFLVTYSEPLPEWKNRMMFGLYNTQTQEWVYERKLLVEPHWNAGVQHTPIIYNNKVYAAAGNYLVCHDIVTGEQLWRREFDQDFLYSGFIIEEDKIIANNEDLTLYCLDLETGSEIWTGEGAGTCSRMSYLNGIVYFVGGGDSRFHAVDIETGETVWRLDAKKLEGSDGMFKTNAVYVIPGENGNKGKVIALTHMYAYCFEAYR